MAGNFNINGFNLGKATIVPNISRWNMLYHNIMRPIWAIFPKIKQNFIEKRLPRGHMGEAEELLPIIDFLISPQASMMGGSVIPIDAGEGHYYA